MLAGARPCVADQNKQLAALVRAQTELVVEVALRVRVDLVVLPVVRLAQRHRLRDRGQGRVVVNLVRGVRDIQARHLALVAVRALLESQGPPGVVVERDRVRLVALGALVLHLARQEVERHVLALLLGLAVLPHGVRGRARLLRTLDHDGLLVGAVAYPLPLGAGRVRRRSLVRLVVQVLEHLAERQARTEVGVGRHVVQRVADGLAGGGQVGVPEAVFHLVQAVHGVRRVPSLAQQVRPLVLQLVAAQIGHVPADVCQTERLHGHRIPERLEADLDGQEHAGDVLLQVIDGLLLEQLGLLGDHLQRLHGLAHVLEEDLEPCVLAFRGRRAALPRVQLRREVHELFMQAHQVRPVLASHLVQLHCTYMNGSREKEIE
mmetsp:Transcript_9550/g.35763  ORF Transcript_9550/g.35763 Transcript_9550/m.35763 type:complete len:377 (-) Transcript_9550:23-1153(-)